MKKTENTLVPTAENYKQLMDFVNEVAERFYQDKIAEKEKVAVEIKTLQAQVEDLKKQYTASEDWKHKNELQTTRLEIQKEINELEFKLKNFDNFIKAIKNGGEYVSFTDALGQEVKDIPDFRRIPTELILFSQETILADELPNYIPVIDEKAFEYRGCIFDAIRVTTDSYILSPFRYQFGKETQFILLTLDQLVLTSFYYITKLKAQYQAEADRKTQRNIDYYYTLSTERREKNFSQKGYYQSLPAKVKKQVTEDAWNALSLDEKEKLDIPIKKYGPKRINSKLEDNTMYVSFHEMYNQFINPKALKFTINKTTSERTEIPLGETVYGQYGHHEVFEYWNKFSEMMQYKFKDIEFQRLEQSETYQLAIETSFGESNTKDTLYADYGVLVKRQNGDEINLIETEQIRESLNKVQSVFGNLKDQFIKANMKISHKGNRLVFARKALGVYIYSMGTIAASNKYGDLIFNSVMAHEISHMIDHEIGALTGHRWATDDYESTAGKIAFTFRNNMNKPKKEQTNYVNATKECFARAFEQYFAVKTYGDDVEIIYSDNPSGQPEHVFKQDEYVNKEIFYTHISPLIQQFLSENKSFFGEIINYSNQKSDLNDTINGLEILLETAQGKLKENLSKTITGLKLLIQ